MRDREVLAVILAGGRGERLDPLTRDRAKPAVHFGGSYRIIDFTLSNCVNSGVRRVLLLTQFKSMSLDRHVNLGWRHLFRSHMDEFIDIVPPQQRIEAHWYLGTADAVYQNIYTIERENPKYVLVLGGDHIYRMDYGEMIAFHKENDADMTVAALPVNVEDASQFGIMTVDGTQRVIAFHEKPQQPATIPGDDKHCLASMGIYVFTARFLYEVLLEDAVKPGSTHDFGKDIIPSIYGATRVFAYPFRGKNNQVAYWRDVGTLDAYYEANMDLVEVNPQLDLYDEEWPIRTYMQALPPPKFVFRGGDDGQRRGEALDSLVCPGTIISGAHIEKSIVGPKARIHSYSRITDSILFEGVEIERRCRIRRAIIEKNVSIPPDTEIGYDHEQDTARGFTVSPGGVVVVMPTAQLLDKARRQPAPPRR